MGTGDPSLERLSGVWTPLEWAESAPVWLGEAGALLQTHALISNSASSAQVTEHRRELVTASVTTNTRVHLPGR